MDNQHKLIKGYRDLPQEEIDLMNEIKDNAEQIRALIGRITSYCADREAKALSENKDGPHSIVTSPLRWAAIAQTDLQQGFMALTRAVAAPTTF